MQTFVIHRIGALNQLYKQKLSNFFWCIAWVLVMKLQCWTSQKIRISWLMIWNVCYVALQIDWIFESIRSNVQSCMRFSVDTSNIAQFVLFYYFYSNEKHSSLWMPRLESGTTHFLSLLFDLRFMDTLNNMTFTSVIKYTIFLTLWRNRSNWSL